MVTLNKGDKDIIIIIIIIIITIIVVVVVAEKSENGYIKETPLIDIFTQCRCCTKHQRVCSIGGRIATK